MDTKLWIMAIMLGVLIVVSAVQTVELVNLKSKLDSGVTSMAVKTQASAGSTNTLSSNLQNLPTMVGGC